MIGTPELLHGVERANSPERKAARKELVDKFLAQIVAIDFDLSVARRHAALRASLERSGTIIGPYDLLIAATALDHNHRLVTLNKTEFQQVPSLDLVETVPFMESSIL